MTIYQRFIRCSILLCGLAAPAWAQEDAASGLIDRLQNSTATRKAQEQAAMAPPQTDDKHEIAVFHHKRGMAHYTLGNYDQSVNDLQIALRNNMPSRIAVSGWGDLWRLQNDLGTSLRRKGDLLSENVHWQSLAAQYPSNWSEHHLAKLMLARVHLSLGDFASAEQSLKDADETLRQMANRNDWGWLKYNQIYLNQARHAHFMAAQGNMREAERLRRLALDNAQEDFNLQLRSAKWLRVAAENLAYARGDLAAVLVARGKFGEAEFFAQATVEDAIKYAGPSSIQTAQVLGLLAYIRHQSGNLVGAEKLYRHALTVALKSGGTPKARLSLGELLVEQERWHAAMNVFKERAEDLQSDPATQLRTDSIAWALALHRSGSSQAAKDMAERLIAIQHQRSVPNSYHVARQRGVLGMTLTSLGDLPGALAAFQQALPEMVRSDSDNSAAEGAGVTRVFWRTEILEAYVDLLARLQTEGKVPPGLDAIAESFRTADLARGSSVQAAIAASATRAQLPNVELAGLVRRDQDTQNQAVALDKILAKLVTAPEAERLNKIIADMRTEVERLRKEHLALQDDIHRRFPEFGDLIAPKPATLAEVRKALAPGEALVSIYLGKAQSYVWTVGDQGKTGFRVVPIGRAEVDADVAKLRAGLMFDDDDVRPSSFDLTRASKLYQAFLAPDAELWRQAKVLSVIPHGSLGQIPFSLLPTETARTGDDDQGIFRNTPWLIRKVALAQLPSATAFLALRRSPLARAGRTPFIGFGDPLFVATEGVASKRGRARNLSIGREGNAVDEQLSLQAGSSSTIESKPRVDASRLLANAFRLMPSLPDTSDELMEIAAALKADPGRDVYVGRRATESQVKQTKLDDRRVVAFATHGIASGEVAGLDQPALVLSNPALTGEADADGFFTMDEVLGLKLDADWVVLSACNTASPDGKASEAVSGLGRAFFFAGARSLLVSSWAVETTSARQLTTALFRREVENPSLPRAEALRQAMLDVMKTGDPKAGLSYAHPAFWAPFSLVGDGMGK
ncbi:CHAT domain-containing protein [Sulfuritalea hydrogenivorans]|jgi:CHAT domain-containing protein|uniref:CHAT domain-containing protein n=1 Tax=Sulfuritalea hydrogenivorans sk43H TaxID=1223802 RepID=W0SDE0_9PROT|nr:CHAT domain-containing protein [Sulfuritalea hydrogenivorans]BAO28942.1 hypothetical protein SUTH_01142 [Sulfuritalea hydrogenivorans sk43H]